MDLFFPLAILVLILGSPYSGVFGKIHWVIGRYYLFKDVKHTRTLNHSDIILVRNSGTCQRDILAQYYGLGSETRRTATDIPDPFEIIVGNPAKIPEGYEEKWLVNIHAIDTRGVVDKMGCTECKCELYNVTNDEYGELLLRPDYKGGLLCCYDQTQCRLREGFVGQKRNLYLRCTVKWVNWDKFIVPVKIYILDVTDTSKISHDSKGMIAEHDCQIEYEVESCSTGNEDGNDCLHVKRTNLSMKNGGYVIYGVAHQHSGGTGSMLYGQLMFNMDLYFPLAILVLILGTPYSSAFGKSESNVKTAVFLSPKFELGPGSVANKFDYDIDFPRGHIALKSFNAEVVDEAGNSVALHETYLHHWVVARYYQPKYVKTHTSYDGHRILHNSDYVFVRNSGLCQRNTLGQYFGLGSETRGTATDVPDPFGIAVGDPAEIPEGYEEKWMFNIHAIDTRGVVDKRGCTECKCELYNVTKDAYGKPLMPDYKGGLKCCYDQTQCRLREGFEGPKRSLYLRYTVKWVDWDKFLVPVKIYIFDVTDTIKISDDSGGMIPEHDCQIEYDVESCSTDQKDGNGCLHVQKTSLPLQKGGYVIYGVAHQHSGGTGSTLYGQDGRVICSSIPSYGKGKEAGNEADYIVGMSTCYPRPGSVNIIDGETLTLESNYSSSREHTGVMGLFYLLVAEQLPHQHLKHTSRSSFFIDINSIVH
ncbi:hypothetical protein glysoja_027946 [Glycine soja]|uniref:Stress up-regulated Nod 19 protein n=2 Tax=Glycine soja TaxID=3848 RepID=A0A0B2RXH4_GLYSO|nr:hypothetical protein glysoja_027946 [Glycine soja]